MGIIYELADMKRKSMKEAVPFSEMFTSEFMKRYTKFSSLDELKHIANEKKTKIEI